MNDSTAGRAEARVVLFTDVHDFARLMTELGPRQLDFLDAFYCDLGQVVVDHGGQLVKYIGDALLCTFPEDSEDQAVRCGLSLRQAHADLLARWQLCEECVLEVGISAGEVCTGTVGHTSLRVEDVFGAPVFEAAVIGHHRGVAVTAAVHARLGDVWPTRALPERPLKWRPEPLQVWEVVARAQSP